MACWTCTSASAPSIGARTLDALKPFTLDAGSFETLPELLEKTGALDLASAEHAKRLSDKALVRITIDLESTETAPDHWVPTTTEGVWQKLLEDTRIRDLRIKVKQQLKNGGYEPTAVAPFESKESESCGYEPFCYAD
jgi:hypothetical protein